MNHTPYYGIGILCLIAGIFIGWLAFGTSRGMHRMPDGTMMSNRASMHSMQGMMDDMNAALRGKTGDDFDRAFIDEMIVHHEGAVEMAQLVLQNSKRPELIKLANDIIAAQTKEIDMMKQWRAAWFQ